MDHDTINIPRSIEWEMLSVLECQQFEEEKKSKQHAKHRDTTMAKSRRAQLHANIVSTYPLLTMALSDTDGPRLWSGQVDAMVLRRSRADSSDNPFFVFSSHDRKTSNCSSLLLLLSTFLLQTQSWSRKVMAHELGYFWMERETYCGCKTQLLRELIAQNRGGIRPQTIG